MDNQFIIQAMTLKGFDFNESSLQAKTLAIEKYRQYYGSVVKYFTEAGIQNLAPLNDIIHNVVSDATKNYIDYYDQLLQAAQPDKSVPLDAVHINMNKLADYGGTIANDLHENVTAILHEKGLTSEDLLDADYLDKLSRGYVESEEE